MVEITGIMIALILFVVLLAATLLLLSGAVPGFNLAVTNLTKTVIHG